MKRLTAVIAAVAALGMATPSWSKIINNDQSTLVLTSGTVLSSYNRSDGWMEILITFGGDLYWCRVGLEWENGNFRTVCFDKEFDPI